MRLQLLLAGLASVILLSDAQAGRVRGNDTSGIIPWSREAERTARAVAGAHCGTYGKFARITGVVRQYGNYISFNCLWNPRIARYALPPVPLARQSRYRIPVHR